MAREVGQLTSMTQDVVDNFAMNVWKVFPWTNRNRAWLGCVIQAYLMCNVLGFFLACVLNSVEGHKWINSSVAHHHVSARGGTALDECWWFVFTTMHGTAFGEFIPRGFVGHIIACICCSLGYWFVIFLCCIVMFSQLPGEKTPTFWSTLTRMVSAVWPSYLVFCTIVVAVGAQCGPYISQAHYGYNDAPMGIYFMWQVAHRMPYGDLWPNTPTGYAVTVPAAILGLLYMPYTMALVAVRCPSMAQHEALLSELRQHPEDAFGRGYVMPEMPVAQPKKKPRALGGTDTELQALSGTSA